MRRVLGGRQRWITASACAVWTLAFLADQGPAAFATAPIVLICILVLPEAPVAAGLVLAAVSVASGVWLAVPAANPALLAPGVVAVYAAGRRVARWRGLLVVAGFALAGWWVDELSVASGLFVAFVFGGTWLFGSLVRRRTESARAARLHVSTLSGEDLAEITREAVAVERAQLAGAAVEVLRAAVARMRTGAMQASQDLDRGARAGWALERIHADGTAAVTELRRLLGLLRSTSADLDASAAQPGAALTRRTWLVDGLAAVAAGLLMIPDHLSPGEPHDTVALLAGLVPCAALLLRRRRLTTAISLAALPVAAVLVFDLPMVNGIGDILVIALLGWSVGGSPERWPWTAFTALAALHLGWAGRDNPGNLPITAVTFALPLLAGHAWAERDRETAAAQAESRVLLDRRETQISHAVTEERLRIARELHDVASHAIGVMVLHAGAAQALRTTAPDQARESLRTVEVAGAQALTELTTLRDVLSGPTESTPKHGDPGRLLGRTRTDLRLAIADLADRLSSTGLVVDLQVGVVPAGPELATAAYHVVQEALTNAARHAPGSRAQVRVNHEGGDLVVEVLDDGAARAGRGGTMGTGHGLLGLGERVRLLGGDLVAAPGPQGGFRVCARIPDPSGAPDASGEPDAAPSRVTP